MILDKEAFTKAVGAYYSADGDTPDGIEAAIETYITEAFKPGQLVIGEPIESARDYRKELWVDIATSVARSENAGEPQVPGLWANETLAMFDKKFPEGK